MEKFTNGSGAKEQIQLMLREKLRSAENKYRLAAKAHKEAVEAAKTMQWRADSDSVHALQRAAMLGGDALRECAQVLEAFAQVILGGTPAPRDDSQVAKGLSPRETEVLKLIGAGFSTKQIAAQLGITFKTAATHRSSIMQKLNAQNAAALVRQAIRSGLLEL